MIDLREVQVIAELSVDDTALHREAITLLQEYRNKVWALCRVCDEFTDLYDQCSKHISDPAVLAELDAAYAAILDRYAHV